MPEFVLKNKALEDLEQHVSALFVSRLKDWFNFDFVEAILF